jgi:hypothetical protein
MDELLTQYGSFDGILRLIHQYLLWGLNATPGAESAAILAAKIGVPTWAILRVARQCSRDKRILTYNRDGAVVSLRDSHDEEA